MINRTQVAYNWFVPLIFNDLIYVFWPNQSNQENQYVFCEKIQPIFSWKSKHFYWENWIHFDRILTQIKSIRRGKIQYILSLKSSFFATYSCYVPHIPISKVNNDCRPNQPRTLIFTRGPAKALQQRAHEVR